MTACCSRFTQPATARSKSLLRVGSIRRSLDESRAPPQPPLGIANASFDPIVGQDEVGPVVLRDPQP
jgi:hypothetical protein